MIQNILKGTQAYFQSFKLISELKLWKYFTIPILISFVVAFIIMFSAYGLSDNIGSLLSKLWIWEWGKESFAAVGTVLGAVIIIAIGLILYKHIVMALVSPFMSPVSEKIETYYLQKEAILQKESDYRTTTFQQQLIRGIRINIRNLVKELLYTILLLILSFVPIINFLPTPLLFLTQAYYAGFGNMDYTLERHYNYRESIRFVKKNKGLAIGNGIIFTLLLLIPIIGFIIVLPMSVTAASLKTVEKIHNER